MKHPIILALFVATVAAIALSSCGACEPQVGAEKSGFITGTVIKGPVKAATVTAFALDENGRRTDEVGTGTTADDGTFSIEIGGHTGPALVCASSGTYTEEATGGLVQLGATELCAFVDDQVLGATTGGLLLTPFSSFHAALTACFKETGREGTLSGASNRASLRLNDFLAAGTSGFDFRSTPAFDVTAGTAPGLTPEVWHGILLAGLSESARQISLASDLDPGVRVTAATLSTELLRDLDDGACVFDGQGPSGQLSQGNVALSANSLRGAPQGLAQSIDRFLQGDRNLSGVQDSSVSDLTRALSTHQSEIFGGEAQGDLDAPVISFIEPSPGPVSGQPTVHVQATDASEVTELAFEAPDQLVDQGTMVCSPERTTCDLTELLNTALEEPGDVTITVRATDLAGNTSRQSVTVTINNSIPQIAVESPTSGGACSTPAANCFSVAGTVRIRAEASDEDGIESFTLTIPGVTLADQCAPPLLTTNCDSEPDPQLIDVLWDTTQALEGETDLLFVATDTASNPASKSIKVEVDNIAAGTLNGRVDIGGPVVGATITALQFTDGVRGPQIGQTTSNEAGAYQLQNPNFSGPVLVVATGGTFVDPSSGQAMSLRTGQELTCAVFSPVAGGATTMNVNLWTTLATRRALATLSSFGSLQQSLTTNYNLFASHLLRPGTLSLTNSVSADLLVEQPAPSDAVSILALTQAGISRLAGQASLDIGGAIGQITPVDILDVLLVDVSDGTFDGSDSGTPLFLDQNSLPADSYVIRTTLAFRIDNFVRNAPFRHNGAVVLEAVRNNATTITSAALAGTDLLYDDLAKNRSVLFPPDEPVIPFDQTPPTIRLGFDSPNADQPQGAALTGVVKISGTATDTSGVSLFEVLGPNVPDLFSAVLDLHVELDSSVPPNPEDAFALCGVQLGDPPYNIADSTRQVCLCVEARDVLDNIAHEVQCFTRPAPVITSNAPPFIGPQLSSIAVDVSADFLLESCAGEFIQNGTSSGLTTATASGQTCTVSVPVPALGTQSVTLSARATEIGGATTTTTFSFTVDTAAPTVAITAPAAGVSVNAPPVITATAADPNLVSVVATISDATTTIATLEGTTGAGSTFTFPAFTDTNVDGIRTISVTATDAAGNTAVDTRNYTYDRSPPVLTFASTQALQYIELSETAAVTPSAGCTTAPFSACTFDVPLTGNNVTRVDLNTNPSTPPTYLRWFHLVGIATNPATSSATRPAEGRAPILRLQTDPNITVNTVTGTTCPADNAAFEALSLQTTSSNAAGIVDVPITSTIVATATNTGTTTFCLTMRARDSAGNKGPLLNHFYRYRPTTPPVSFIWNGGGYVGASVPDDVLALNNGQDDDAVSGTGQPSNGRIIGHAYVVLPSGTTNYTFHYTLNSITGREPTLTVNHRRTIDLSSIKATKWWSTGATNLANPNCASSGGVSACGTTPTWSGTGLASGATTPSFARYVSGGSLSTASAGLEHTPLRTGETDFTGSGLTPPTTVSTTTDVQLQATATTSSLRLGTLVTEVRGINSVTGLPLSTVLATSTTGDVTFTAGGGVGSNAVIILIRAVLPSTRPFELRTAQAVNGSLPFFNNGCRPPATCIALSPETTAPAKLANGHWIFTAQSAAATGTTPSPPEQLLWMKNALSSGSSTADIRYGRFYDDYNGAIFSFASGLTFTTTGKTPFGSPVAMAARAIPSGTTRTLTQD